MAALAEWVEWDAEPGVVALDDGREAPVVRGDLLFIEMRDGEVVFVEHRPRTLH